MIICIYDFVAVGPSSMPCQLMVGFLAYAKSFEINVDKKELEGNIITQLLLILTSFSCFDVHQEVASSTDTLISNTTGT